MLSEIRPSISTKTVISCTPASAVQVKSPDSVSPEAISPISTVPAGEPSICRTRRGLTAGSLPRFSTWAVMVSVSPGTAPSGNQVMVGIVRSGALVENSSSFSLLVSSSSGTSSSKSTAALIVCGPDSSSALNVMLAASPAGMGSISLYISGESSILYISRVAPDVSLPWFLTVMVKVTSSLISG